MISTRLPARSALVCALLAAASAVGAKVTQTALFTDTQTVVGGGTLITWDDKRMRAQVTDGGGSGVGRYVVEGAKRTITYDSPRVSDYISTANDCPLPVHMRSTITQTVVTLLDGTARKGHSGRMDLGVATAMDGCHAGEASPIGDPVDTGTAQSHVAMSAAPPQRPLVPGEIWAGLIESPMDGGYIYSAQDTAQLDANGSAFVMTATGSVLPASVDADGWLSTRLSDSTLRKYKRVSLNARTGAEVWMFGDSDGRGLRWVNALRMVTPQPGAAFTQSSAAHAWRKADAQSSTEFRLYSDMTGFVVYNDYPPGMPLTWRFAPQALSILRESASYQRDRLWLPLARFGKQQWVMESEQMTLKSDGQISTLIKAHVAWYTDMGAAVKPPATATAPRATADTARRETAAAARPRR